MHVKLENVRLYDLSDEENPVHLDETMTIANLKFCNGQTLLVESESTCSNITYCIPP